MGIVIPYKKLEQKHFAVETPTLEYLLNITGPTPFFSNPLQHNTEILEVLRVRNTELGLKASLDYRFYSDGPLFKRRSFGAKHPLTDIFKTGVPGHIRTTNVEGLIHSRFGIWRWLANTPINYHPATNIFCNG